MMTENQEALSLEETRRLLHELQVHQSELEMQNVELRMAQAHLDVARARYFDLYDLAPVGYCTLSEKGLVMEANLTAATLLGATRGALTERPPFSRFILEEDQCIYYHHVKQLSMVDEQQTYELRMVREDKTSFWVRLEIVAMQDAEGTRVRRVVFSDITERKKTDEKIQALSQSLIQAQERERYLTERKKTDEKIQALSQSLIQAQERERYLLSCELHDSIAQNLSALKINNDLIYTDMPMIFPDLRKKLAVSSSLIVETIVAVRNLAYDLRLPGLEEFGIVKALEIYCGEASEEGNVKFDFQSSGMSAIVLDRNVEIHIYRLIQECMNNIRKHADADRATILLLGSSPNVILHIRDNGRGFDVKAQELSSAATKRMGISGMQERVRMIHGSMIINSQPMEGTHISIKIPLQKNLSGNPEKHKSSINPLPKIYSE
jgi:PAS domain S-box-containing protein